jgi:hypothetical protein
MRETDIEKYLRKEAVKRGALAMKFTSPGLRGVPDRLVCFPGGIQVFVELKAPGKKPSKQQQYRIKQLEALGCIVRVIDTKAGVDNLIWEFCLDKLTEVEQGFIMEQ